MALYGLQFFVGERFRFLSVFMLVRSTGAFVLLTQQTALNAKVFTPFLTKSTCHARYR